MDVSPTVIDIITNKPRKWLVSHAPYMCDAQGEPVRISGWTYPACCYDISGHEGSRMV